jgi:hypothetical protein
MDRDKGLGSKRFIDLPTWLAVPAAAFGAIADSHSTSFRSVVNSNLSSIFLNA